MNAITPNKLWISIFAVWIVFLSGLLNSFVTSPGMLQALQLQRILNLKQRQIDISENQLIALQDDCNRLERNKTAQEREVRRVLGYASPQDLIFDFTGEESITRN